MIDMDGNSYSGRFPKILALSGAAIFKMAAFEDIATIAAKPWIHYVPVNIDLTDFDEKMEWAKKNDA